MRTEEEFRQLVHERYAADPQFQEDVKRATFAYHFNHYRDHPKAHHFRGGYREAACQWCGRTREQVRWDGLPPECMAVPKDAHEPIENVIRREEELFAKVIGRAKVLAAKLDIPSLTGQELARLHHTHGIDPSMLECALLEEGRALPQHLFDEYEIAYEEHCHTGKAGEKKIIIVAK